MVDNDHTSERTDAVESNKGTTRTERDHDGQDEGSSVVSRRKVLASTGAVVGTGLFTQSAAAADWCSPDTSWDFSKKHHGEINTRCRYRFKSSFSNLLEEKDPDQKGYEKTYIGFPGHPDNGDPDVDGIRSLHIHVHGFNTSHSGARDGFSQNADAMGMYGARDELDWLFGFTWDADLGTPPQWKPAKTIARSNGARLARYIKAVKDHSPNMHIFLSAHSLGSQVLMEAVRYLKDELYAWNSIDGVFFMGAAIPNVCLAWEENAAWEQYNYLTDGYETIKGYGRDLYYVLKNPWEMGPRRVVNLISNNDDVLRHAYPWGEWVSPKEGETRPLGLDGFNREIEGYDYWCDQIDASQFVSGHTDYTGNREVWQALKRRKTEIIRKNS